MNTFLAILATGIGTYFSRSAFILLLADRRIPPDVLLALQYVAPSVLGALIMTMMVGPSGDTEIGVAEICALVMAGVVAWRSRNAIYTLITGMAIFWFLGALFA